MADYTNAAEIRRKSGIIDNLQISTASIEAKATIATGIVNGYIGHVYSLPLSGGAPLVIQELTTQIADALILKEEYGPEVNDSDKDGQAKFDSALEILEKIKDGEMKLYNDTTSSELTKTRLFKPRFLGNDTTDQLTTTASTAPKIRMGDKY